VGPVSRADGPHVSCAARSGPLARPAGVRRHRGAPARARVRSRQDPLALIFAGSAPDSVRLPGREREVQALGTHRAPGADRLRLVDLLDGWSYRRQREEQLGIGGQACSSRAPVGFCVSHCAQSFCGIRLRPRAGCAVIASLAIDPCPWLRRLFTAAPLLDRPCPACGFVSYPCAGRAGREDQPAGLACLVRLLARAPLAAARSGFLARAGRSGLSPTRSTIIVMSSIRSPAVKCSRVR
jgi:hypothetical protein